MWKAVNLCLNVKINRKLLIEIKSYNPNLVLVYNSEYLLPETCREIRKQARLIFYLGDSPFFTHTNDHYIQCLSYADIILSPDTFWINQLNTIGLSQTLFFVPGLDGTVYYPVSDENSLRDIESHDIIYTGSSYKNSWGYKKALLMSCFSDFNFKIYGDNSWERWFGYFPELKPHYTKSGFIPADLLNRMYNRSRLMPVDANPGILNGFHLRLIEALGAGVLPLVEYRKDVDELLFSGCDAKVPLIRDYRKARDLAKYYLDKESERAEIASCLRDFVSSEYDAFKNAERLSVILKG